MPNPKQFKDRASFMRKCVPMLIGEGRENDQAVAICSQMWRDRDKEHEAAEGGCMKSLIKSMPKLRMEGSFAPETLNDDARTVDIRWYTGAKVSRYSFVDGTYMLSFSMDPKHVRMDRLATGRAPFKAGHSAHDELSAVIGVIEKAWLGRDGGQATVRFSSRPEVDGIYQDIKDGILTNVSMEAAVHELNDITEKGADVTHYMAVDWEPMAVALVAVGADPAAQALSVGEDLVPCKFNFRAEASAEATNRASAPIRKGVDMEEIQVRLRETGEIVTIKASEFNEQLHEKLQPPKEEKPPAASVLDAAKKVEEAIARDHQLAAEVRRVADHYGLDDLWAQDKINQSLSIENVIKLAQQERAKRNPKPPTQIGFGQDYDSIKWRSAMMVEALVSRATRKPCPEQAKQYARHSFGELALEYLANSGRAYEAKGLHPRADAEQIFALALHTTSDFPLLLANALNKMLLPAYENANPVYRQLASQRTFNDYRAHRFLRTGDFPMPLVVGEHGEYQRGSLTENEEQVTLAKYGRILGLTEEMLVNDDVGGFEDIATKAGQRIADFENALFFSTCITVGAGLGPILSDAARVFAAGHGNLAAAGALDVAKVGESRALMMVQTSLDGISLNVVPEILLVSPASYTLAEQITAPLSALTGGAATTLTVNPFAGRLRPVADANLTGTRFYLFASPARLPNYIYGYLGGATGPRTEVRNGFDVDGIEFKVSLRFGVGAIDYRGGVTGAGV